MTFHSDNKFDIGRKKAYTQLQQIIDELYEAVDNALENDDFESASEPSH